MKRNPQMDIAIPTLNREKKCTVCVDSLLAGSYENIKVFLLFSDRNELFRYARQYQHDQRVRCEMTDYSKVSICWNDFVARSEGEFVLFLCDDVALDVDCLRNALKVMRRRFSNGDGVIGLNVTNYPPSWPEAITQYGFRLVGRKFHASTDQATLIQLSYPFDINCTLRGEWCNCLQSVWISGLHDSL